jgi:nucleoside 2-deoxyribosyltransferase/Zn ribbon nucleic-acid-binding protein
MAQCPFCDNSSVLTLSESDGKTINHFECKSCGSFDILDLSDLVIKNADKKYLIAGYLHEKKDLRYRVEIITRENFTSLFDNPIVPKTTNERLMKLLMYIYRNTKEFGQTMLFDESWIPSYGYAKNINELKNLIEALRKGNLIEIDQRGKYGQFPYFNFSLTPQGFSTCETLLNQEIKKRTKAFVAMAFTPEMLQIQSSAIKQAAYECGFEAFTVSEEEHNEDINDKIIANIKESRFVIADFTGQRGGVYFEAGFAQGLGIPVIRTCKEEESKKLHFDISHYNFIFWETPEELKDKLYNRIRATIL